MECIEWIIIILIVITPFILTGWNVVTLIRYLIKQEDKLYYKKIELIAMFIGVGYLVIYIGISQIKFVSWYTQLYNSELHSIISPDAFDTILMIAFIGFLGYIVARFVPVHEQSPIVATLSISAMYMGIGVCILWCIQTSKDFFLVLFPINCIIIFMKTIYILVYERHTKLQNGDGCTKFKRLSNILNKATNLPWLALLLMIPLLGIIIIILTLFGQEPSSIIKAWTETADWNLSQKVGPQNISYDQHYLCTVAAGGHRKIVKPLRTGIRHGHRVVVNRQLCIANAFEQILEEKVPVLHKVIRKTYDKTGYPISKHIHSKYVADIIYFIMKPLEWVFLMVIYAVDVEPENRIAVQYPHSTPYSSEM